MTQNQDGNVLADPRGLIERLCRSNLSNADIGALVAVLSSRIKPEPDQATLVTRKMFARMALAADENPPKDLAMCNTCRRVAGSYQMKWGPECICKPKQEPSHGG
jgi:hypothetical protein